LYTIYPIPPSFSINPPIPPPISPTAKILLHSHRNWSCHSYRSRSQSRFVPNRRSNAKRETCCLHVAVPRTTRSNAFIIVIAVIMPTRHLKVVPAASASPAVPTKVTLDGAVWDLSNLMSPSSDPYRNRTPRPTGRSSGGSSTTDSYDGSSLESEDDTNHKTNNDKNTNTRKEHSRRRRVRFQDVVDDNNKREDLFFNYPKIQDIPSALDIDDIFAKLSANKMLRLGRPANPGLPSSFLSSSSSSSSSGMYSRKEEEVIIGLSPRSTATPRCGGDGTHEYHGRINSSMLSPGGRTRLTVDLDEMHSPVSQPQPQRPYFGLDSPPPSSSRPTVSGGSSTRRGGGESGDSRQRGGGGGGGGSDPRYNDRNPRSPQQQQQQYRNQQYYDQQVSYGRRLPPPHPQRGGRGDDYFDGRDEYSYRRDHHHEHQHQQQQRQQHQNSRDRYYYDREDFRRQNTRTYYDEYEDVDDFGDDDFDGRPRSLSPTEGRSRSYDYEDDPQQQQQQQQLQYLDYEEQGYDSYSYSNSSRHEKEEPYRQGGAPPPQSLRDTRTLVEVVPGEFVPLRGSGETWQAIQAGRVMNTSCACCFLKMLVLEHVDLVMCSGCRVISPVNEGRGGGGLGLGMAIEDARKELDRRR
jgi:hypothetical protein